MPSHRSCAKEASQRIKDYYKPKRVIKSKKSVVPTKDSNPTQVQASELKEIWSALPEREVRSILDGIVERISVEQVEEKVDHNHGHQKGEEKEN